MHVVYIALGSNLGTRKESLREAINALPPQVVVRQTSPIYETAPWGLTNQPAFLNMVVKGETSLDPLELLKHLKQIETRMGRVPAVRWGPRKIDMDILLYEDLVFDSPALTIPHPHMPERGFVLVPLADLAEDYRHPVLHKTIRELLSTVDITGVKKYE
jgi:2-amino-4-hydroxy-6-hydroxymethyldihydropteridine diphosphokinase